MASKPHNPGQLGLFRPESSWKPPTELPDLRGRPVVAIDSETKDDGLASNRGPGWALGPAGYICGVSWATEGSVGYAPIRHPDTECFPLDNVMRWLDDLFKSGTRIVMHNGPYDLGWFGCYGVEPPVNLEDTLAGAVMLDESQAIYKPGERPYSLDNCCARYNIPGKDMDLLRDAVRAYGGNAAKPTADLWRLPGRYVGPYAEQDGVATLDLWRVQEPQLRAQDVWDAYRLELDLIPLVVAMRRRGIRIDVDKAKRTGDMFRARAKAGLEELSNRVQVGRRLTVDDVRSPAMLERLFNAESISFPRTEKTKQGSFSADWMRVHPHWLPQLVSQIKRDEEAATKFIDNYLLGFVHRGRIHAEVHQFKSDEGGTKSHRFSYSEPPLQQMPTPDKDPTDDLKQIIEDRAYGVHIRRCFLPERNTRWLAADYSQQEPRLTIHFAALCKARGADDAVQKYLINPRQDYHTMVAQMTGKPRSQAKILNLAMTYNLGIASLAEKLGVSIEEAKAIFDDYHQRLPFVKALDDTCKSAAERRGYIRLIDGARMRYEEWDGPYLPSEVRYAATQAGHSLSPCSLQVARERQENPDHPWHGKRLRRFSTRTALNNLVQGSAARQTKRAMLDCWREGIMPLIQMHDEIGCPAESEAKVNRIADIMVNAIPLKVPVVVDAEVGPTWGDAKLSWADCEAKYGPLQRLAA